MVDSVGLAKSCEYVRVLVRGVFDHSRERHVFAGVQNVGTDSTCGYWVFTPFTPNGAGAAGATNPGGRPILVNRGFVPEGFKEPGTRSDGQIANEVEIVAQVRTRELRKWSDGANAPEKNIYFVREPRELGILYPKQVDNVPVLTAGYFYLEVVGDAPRGGFPKPIASTIEVSNRHLEYALTWYGLAVALVGVFLAFAVSRWKQPKGATRD
jgi:surfeit locus 1 family protein